MLYEYRAATLSQKIYSVIKRNKIEKFLEQKKLDYRILSI
jgi:hypothetical protein